MSPESCPRSATIPARSGITGAAAIFGPVGFRVDIHQLEPSLCLPPTKRATPGPPAPERIIGIEPRLPSVSQETKTRQRIGSRANQSPDSGTDSCAAPETSGVAHTPHAVPQIRNRRQVRVIAHSPCWDSIASARLSAASASLLRPSPRRTKA